MGLGWVFSFLRGILLFFCFESNRMTDYLKRIRLYVIDL